MEVILVYSAILVLTGTILYLIIKYLKEKPFGAQFVTDQLSIDVILSVFSTVFVTSVAVIFRELVGPFSVYGAEISLIFQQFSGSTITFNLLSLQVAQFCNVLFSVR